MAALLFALIAMLSQSQELPGAFVEAIVRCEEQVWTSEFRGCVSIVEDGESFYAGWDSEKGWVTGP